MSTAITESGWYKAGPKGLERVRGLDELPDDTSGLPDITELVKVELGEQMAEVPLW